MQHVMIGHQASYAAEHDIPRGNLSDLYPRWLGARELLLHHRDPYGAAVTREIQEGYYGRAIDRTRPYDPTDWQGFAYPVYVSFVLAPTITLPFAEVQTGFRWLLIALTVASVPLWMRILRWPASVWTVATLAIVVLGSFQAIQGVKLQQLSLLVNGLITLSALLLTEGNLLAAGVLLALATIKPQLALPLSAWLLLWAVSDWKSRRNYIFGFVGMVVALVVGGEIVLPGWIGRFWSALGEYRRYNNGAESSLELVFTPMAGRLLTIAVMVGLAVICWRYRHVSTDAAQFRNMFALLLAATVVIVPKEAPYNQVLLVPSVLLILEQSGALWRRGLGARLSLVIAAFIVLWPWLASLGIGIAAVFVPINHLLRFWTVPLYTTLAIPLAVFAVTVLAFREGSVRQDSIG